MSATPGMSIAREGTSLHHLVVGRLRDSILDGTLEAGRKLVERDLCESLDVSRTLVREALRQLQTEGLITSIPHRGPSVAVITKQDALEIYSVRKVLEAEAARGFASNATEEQINELARNVEKLKDPEVQHGSAEQLVVKNKFYATMLEGCGNATIGHILTLLNNRVTMLRRISLASPGRLQESIAEMEKIVAAARARDEDLIARLCAEHVAKAAAIALASFDE